MNQTKSLLLTASLVLALTLTLSCSSGDEGGGGTQGGGSSSSGGEAQTYSFCLLDKMCLEGPYPANDCEEDGGVPSNNCPYNGDGGDESSSSLAQSSSSSVPSSSSLAPSSSSSIQCLDADNGTFTDDRGDKEYRYVTICSQIWMAENLDYVAEGSKCYNNLDSNCDIYGRLYDWATAMALPASCNTSTCSGQIQSPHQGICPDGWHIPSDAEWDVLMTAVGGSITAGTKLKAASGWNSNGNGTNDYGFSALPGGYGYSSGFDYAGDYGEWWSATANGSRTAYSRSMYDDDEYAVRLGGTKVSLYSVRCIKDN